MSQTGKIKKILKNPFVILLGAFAGAYVGYAYPSFGPHAKPFGSLYLSGLKMCVIPFVFVAVSLGISTLFIEKKPTVRFGKLATVFLIFLLFSSVVGTISSIFLKPGNLEPEQISRIIKATGFIPANTIEVGEAIEQTANSGLSGFISTALPSNIFTALASGQVLQIIIFAVILGAALGIFCRTKNMEIPQSMSVVQEILQQIIGAVVTFLPLGIFFLLADQISAVDPAILKAMIRFVQTALIMFLILVFLCSLVIWKRSGLGYFASLGALREPMIIVLSTSSSLVGMPASIQALREKMGFNHQATELTLPLGVSICRYGAVAYFAFIAVFISQVYQIPLSMNAYILIVIGSVLAGLTTSGMTGIATLPMLALVLDPLGLPLSAVLALLVAIDPIMDPLRSMSVLYVNCASTTLIARKDHK